MSNRRLFILHAVASVAATTIVAPARADQPAPLAETDPQAKQFDYVADAARVDRKKYPDFKPGDRCLKCQIYEDGAGQQGACPIFSGKLVAAGGWCNAFN